MRQLIIKISRALFGWPPAPATFEVKQGLITRVARANGLSCFVETGTFRGDMVAAQHDHFQKLFSIELSQELYMACCARFVGDAKVNLIQGDSSVKLRELATQLEEPALFWLDAHYSRGKTAGADVDAPIIEELSGLAVRKNKERDAILIDDARLFGLKSDFPKMQVIRQFVSKNWPNHQFNVESDIICIIPNSRTSA